MASYMAADIGVVIGFFATYIALIFSTACRLLIFSPS